MTERPRGRAPAIPTKRILAEILQRTRTTTKGATIKELLPLFNARPTAFKRFRALERDGLITRVPGTPGQYMLTSKGLVAHTQAEGEDPT